MKTRFTILILGLLLCAAPGRCLADYGILDVSKAKAKELGVTIRMEKNGDAGVRVWMEFTATDLLKEFRFVEVQIGEGESRIMSAPLLVSNLRSGPMAVNFSADPAYLPKSVLRMWVSDARLGGTIYRFRIKDFMDPAK